MIANEQSRVLYTHWDPLRHRIIQSLETLWALEAVYKATPICPFICYGLKRTLRQLIGQPARARQFQYYISQPNTALQGA